MSEERERLIGHPSDYGGRTIEEEEQEALQRTADGDPLVDRGSMPTQTGEQRGDELQGDNDFDGTNAQIDDLQNE